MHSLHGSHALHGLHKIACTFPTNWQISGDFSNGRYMDMQHVSPIFPTCCNNLQQPLIILIVRFLNFRSTSLIIQDAMSIKARPQPFCAMTFGKTTMPTAAGAAGSEALPAMAVYGSHGEQKFALPAPMHPMTKLAMA